MDYLVLKCPSDVVQITVSKVIKAALLLRKLLDKVFIKMKVLTKKKKYTGKAGGSATGEGMDDPQGDGQRRPSGSCAQGQRGTCLQMDAGGSFQKTVVGTELVCFSLC